MTLDPAVIRSLPKVVLHDHLDGGLRPATLIELAQQCGHELPSTDPDALASWFTTAANADSLERYLECFRHTCAVMQTAAAVERVAKEAVEDLAADNVVYAELRFAPELLVEGEMSLQDAVDAAATGVANGERAAAAEGKTITARLLLCGMRSGTRTAEIARLAVENSQSGEKNRNRVVGFDLAGAEEGHLAEEHAEALQIARNGFLPMTLHAGEAAGERGPASMGQAVIAGAARIGHGVQITDEFDVDLDGIRPGRIGAYIRDAGIALEMCPTSNLHTGVIDDLADHPLPLLQQLGFACTVNTDNRLVSGTTMSQEMTLLAEHFEYGIEELFQLTSVALEHAFLPVQERVEILQTQIVPAYEKAAETLYHAGDPEADDLEKVRQQAGGGAEAMGAGAGGDDGFDVLGALRHHHEDHDHAPGAAGGTGAVTGNDDGEDDGGIHLTLGG